MHHRQSSRSKQITKTTAGITGKKNPRITQIQWASQCRARRCSRYCQIAAAIARRVAPQPAFCSPDHPFYVRPPVTGNREQELVQAPSISNCNLSRGIGLRSISL